MTLRELLKTALGLDWTGADPLVSSVVQDHRRSQPGSLFVARAGAKHDGRNLIPQAAALGAVAVLAEDSPLLADSELPVVLVPDAEAVTGPLASVLLGEPSKRMTVTGVTGTDGKTSTSYLLRHLLSGQHRTALISTAGVHDGLRELPTEGHFTTPEAPEVQGLLAAAHEAGSSHVVLESSSHALDRHRLAGVHYDLAVWTNLSEEHLDWHGTLENYLLAKRTLVERAGTAVLNIDDPHFARFAEPARRVISYGLTPGADWHASGIRRSPGGLEFTVEALGRSFQARLPMLGDFNVHNALAAAAAATELGVDPAEAIARLADFPGVPGRMQLLQAEPFSVLVDFAHTPPALVKALAAVRRVATGRLILVIGAAGERDHRKRPALAAAAVQGADLVVFTEEDSRSEDIDGILQELKQGAVQAGARPGQLVLQRDRRQAIHAALTAALPGDLVLLAGKGVEKTLERADEILEWNETKVAEEILAGL